MKWFAGLVIVLVVAVGVAFMINAGNRREADLVFISGKLHGLDPQQSHWMTDFRALTGLYDTLIKNNLETDDIEPGTAESWEISEDGKTYTFHIRKNAKWSNGDDVTAHDYVYGWRRAMLPDYASPYSSMTFYIQGAEEFFHWRQEQLSTYAALPGDQKSAEAAQALWDEAMRKFDEMVGLKAPDDKTLVVQLVNPTPYFLEICAFMTYSPIHEASVKPFLTPPNADTGTVSLSAGYFAPGKMVTNGAYVLKRRRQGNDLLMVANEHYWNRANMKNSSVLIKEIEEKASALTMYEVGDADWWPDVPSVDPIGEQLANSKRPDVHTYSVCGSYFYIFNCGPTLPGGAKNPFADVRVRRAFAMTIDRKTIVSQVTKLNQPVASTFVPVDIFKGYESPIEFGYEAGARFDPEAARALLAEAGYPGGKGMPENMELLCNSNAGHEPVAEFLRNTWQKELGVTIELRFLDTPPFGVERRKHNFAVARGNWFGDFRDPSTYLTMYRTGDGNNDAQWSNSEYDSLLEQAEQEGDPVKRMELLKEAEKVLLSEMPIAPLFFYVDVELYDPEKVSGVNPNVMKNRRLDQIKVIHAEDDAAKVGG